MNTSFSKEESKPIYKMKVEKDVMVKMRDGVQVAVDLYRPDHSGKFPALLSMHPYCKDMEETVPLGKIIKTFNHEFAAVEAGDHEFWATRGFTHVIADVRGTGKSEGEYYNMCSYEEQRDGYDLVEWIASQPWCDGNVGMVGISYLAFIQYLVAAQQPPHLKAIFPQDGWADFYRDIMYQGGILGVFCEALRPIIATNRAVPVSKRLYKENELNRIIEAIKADKGNNIFRNATLLKIINLPEAHAIPFDFIVNRVDGPFYWERSPASHMHKIKVPTYLGSEMHAYPVCMHLPGATTGWERIKSPKKLTFWRCETGGLDRPFHELHDEMLRWYDYWLKGINTGIMDEPPVKIWVRGAERWRYEIEWPPLKKTKWIKYYLRGDKRLRLDPPGDGESSAKINYEPAIPVIIGSVPLSPKPEYLVYRTEPLREDMEIVGHIALYLNASLSSEDADFIVSLKDIDPSGSETPLSRGWLKASHRELDREKSKEWKPYHTHMNPTPVVPGKIYEYAIEIRPIANLFKAGHSIQLEIWPCDYPSEGKHDWTQRFGACHHVAYGKPVQYEILQMSQHPSYLLIPMMTEH